MQGKIKVIHVITRLDKGGSAQNTLLTCLASSGSYEQILIRKLSLESRLPELERRAVEQSIHEPDEKGVQLIPLAIEP